YIKRLLSAAPPLWPPAPARPPPRAALELIEWLVSAGRGELARRCQAAAAGSRVGAEFELPGPVGEENVYRLRPRGLVLCRTQTQEAATLAFFSALVTGNRAALGGPAGRALFHALPEALRHEAILEEEAGAVDAVLTDAEGEELLRLLQEIAARTGAIATVHAVTPTRLAAGELWPLDFLTDEQSIAINTTAAGGNASLMSIG
ncbi:MAG TPA: trifunctional transcriptional regulator/proline dehydrogenase/L-glutamate gamma-semialdehyde dehydrogenase, partial [Roseiarcus sp.]|nr:trifunctional transcriptional regulator/proline dehydrogenase/L-glutamate gamma-semialdehyde dehydrogenase [Roseiarcus sp.]